MRKEDNSTDLSAHFSYVLAEKLRLRRIIFRSWVVPPRASNTMSKIVSLSLAPFSTFFGRLLSVIDRILMTNAIIAHRNGDPPYFGL